MDNTNTERISARVQRTIFSNQKNGYTVLALLNLGNSHNGNNRFTAVATVPFALADGDEIELQGHWVDTKYGRQFQATHLERPDPTTKEGVKAYLSSGVLIGIGPKIAQRIIDTFGDDALAILDNDPKRLTEVKGIGKKTLDKVIDSWREKRAGAVCMMGLCELGLSIAYATRVFKKYGANSVAIVKEDPYRLTEVKGIGFKKADEIAMTAVGLHREHESRIRAGILYALEEGAVKNGHCYLNIEELQNIANAHLNVHARLILDNLDYLIKNKKILLGKSHLVPKSLPDDRIYLPSFFFAEKFLQAQFERLAERPRKAYQKIVDDLKKNDYLAEEQKRAVVTAITSGLSVITGGPGTGKSTTLKYIIKYLEQNDIAYALCAPTGKAAKRISEITGREAKTIHRLLEYNQSGHFSRNKSERLQVDLVIVDESSMIDLFLMAALVEALPMHGSLVLIGDADQLPPVGPGQVLKDLLASGICPVVRFTEIHRQAEGSAIIKTAHEINKGKRSLTVASQGENDPSDAHFIARDNPEDLLNTIIESVCEKFPSLGVPPDEIQVLSPMRKGPIGTERINAAIQERLHYGKEKLYGRYFLGDKVMHLSNDYNKNVYNGDSGFIVGNDAETNTLMVQYDQGRLIEYESYELDDITLAYAITVHKSQGSEWKYVIMPVHEQHYIMLRRDLIYTGVSRGKELLLLLGTKKGLGMAVGNNKEAKRNTGLWR